MTEPARGVDGTARARWLLAARVGLILTAVAILVTAHRLGLLQEFAAPTQLTRRVAELGPWGYVAFIGAYAVLQPFGVPGTVFVVAAPLIWPWPLAFALSMTGTMAASVVGFTFARFLARDWLARRIPLRFRRYEDALAARGLTTVFVLRFVFWMPPLLHAFFGVSKVGFWTHFFGSLLGYVPPLLLVSYFGQELFVLMKELQLELWLALTVLLVALAVLVARCRSCTRTSAPRLGV